MAEMVRMSEKQTDTKVLLFYPLRSFPRRSTVLLSSPKKVEFILKID